MEDIIIKNGLIVDGSGAAAYEGGVAVKDGKIRFVGNMEGLKAQRVIDAKGQVIAPGFIDAHGHSDTSFLEDERSESRIYQGITTEICGMCGYSPFPEENDSFESWRRMNADKPMSTNLCQFAGHGSIRARVMGYADRKPTDEELKEMCNVLEREMKSGAWGMSLGLEYTPGCFACPEELEALGAVVKKYDGLVTAHMRDEGYHIEEAIKEVAEIGKKTGVRVEISHLKLDKAERWGDAPKIWKLIEDYRNQGVKLTADMYVYDASSTGITNRVPKWAIEGGTHMAAEHLKGARRQEVLDHLKTRFPDREWAERCLISDTDGYLPEYEGKTLADLADDLKLDYYLAAAELVIRTNGQASCLFRVMSLDDIYFFLKQDVTVCSDGSGKSFDPAITTNRPHPRSFGSHVRFLRTVREQKLFALEEAVRRITGKTAENIGIKDRGLLRPGMAADITVFDPETVADKAEYTNPLQKPVGISYVVVNGKLALDDGVQTAERAGDFLIH